MDKVVRINEMISVFVSVYSGMADEMKSLNKNLLSRGYKEDGPHIKHNGTFKKTWVRHLSITKLVECSNALSLEEKTLFLSLLNKLLHSQEEP